MSGPDYIGGPIWQHAKRGKIVMAGYREYKGKRFFEVREWAESGDGLVATGKGATWPPEAVASLIEALLQHSQAQPPFRLAATQ
jgi:Transcriptional Coactivator p15 (PC4)